MSKITLRAYNQEIENLIEHGQTDEAVAHCKHILKFFPKHIDTYRLLGKAYLESQRYSEAADIFQRLLSVIPDDFVAQGGMSIIREDEGDLDGAIFHMERAFEIQPSNNVVQNELRRLYGRRDGVEPPRIRMTRGALVRMYMKGELIPQAIAEARVALSEDPRRVDIEILLSKLNFLSGKLPDATEQCGRIIKQLPFCYEANRLLAEILPSTSKAEDAKGYQQTIQALDPYTAFTSTTTPQSHQVPENTVVLERLEWRPGMAPSQQPDWARTVGVELQEPESTSPDWLSVIPPEEVPTEASSVVTTVPTQISKSPPDEQAIQPTDEDLIPEWMKSAGWTKSEGIASETPPAIEGIEETGESIAEAEIPAWLQEIAPKIEPGIETPEDQEKLTLLENLLPPSGEEDLAAASTLNGTPKPEVTIPVRETDEKLPDWLSKEIQKEDESTEKELPDWLRSEVVSPDISESGTLPEWLQNLEEETAISGVAGSEASSLPDWLKDLEEIGKPEESSSTEKSISAAQSMPIFNENLEVPEETIPAIEQPEGEPELGLPEVFTTGISLPEKSLPSEGKLVGIEPALPEAELKPIESKEEIGEVPEAASEGFASLTSEPEIDTAMAWLEALAARQGANEETLLTRPEDRLKAPPEWIQAEAAGTPLSTSTSNVPVEPTEVAPSSEETEFKEPSPSEPITVMQTGTTTFEEEIVQTEQLVSQVPLPVSTEELTKAVEQTQPVAAVREKDIETTPVPPEAKEEIEPTIPEAVSSIISEPPVKVLEPEQPVTEQMIGEQPPQPAIGEMDIESAMAWLESLAARQGADEETLKYAPEDRLTTPPEWVQKETEAYTGEISPIIEPKIDEPIPIEPEEGVPEEIASSEEIPSPPQPEEIESAFSWLESLASRQGVDEDTLLTPPSLRQKTPPDWIMEEAEPPTPSPEEIAQPIEEISVEKEEILMPSTELGDVPVISTIESETVKKEPIEEEMPEWLKGLEVPEQTSDVESTTEVPAWVEEMEVGQSPETGWQPTEEIQVEEIQPPTTVPTIEEIKVTEETLLLGEEGFEQETAKQVVEPTSSTEWIPESVEIPSEEVKTTITKISEAPEEPSPFFPSAKTSKIEDARTFIGQARQSLADGKLDEAVEQYNQLILSGTMLEEVIHDLRNALYRYPVDITLWESLGDAYLRENRLQDALDAFTKAEELLR